MFTDSEKPAIISYGVYEADVDPEFGGQKEICHVTFALPLGLDTGMEIFDEIYKDLKRFKPSCE